MSAQKEKKDMSLSELIEKEYLSCMHKPGTHSKTKARDVFNELCNDYFLNGSFDSFCKKQYEQIIKKSAHIIKPIKSARKWI